MALTRHEALRAIPPISEIMEAESIAALISGHGRDSVLSAARRAVESYRACIDSDADYCVKNGIGSADGVRQLIVVMIENLVAAQDLRLLKQVINATGIVLHTNLGRAPLPQRAIDRMTAVSGGYSNLEFDLASGHRGSRQSHVEEIICKVSGAESAIVVNNNAAAVFLCLNTLASSRGVVISRGQQVEIGGSFRIPDIISRSGARMIEVGTTNKTHLEDYRQAVTDDVSVLLKVHTSNYKVIGFTESVGLHELIDLSKEISREEHDPLIVVEDLGSGSLMDLTEFGIPYEPTVQECIRSGADLVTFSGDKLLGGPQAGIIAGSKKYIDMIRKNPLARMVRCDKNTIAALAAVFEIYSTLEKKDIISEIPVLRMLAMTSDELDAKAETLKNLLKNRLGDRCDLYVCDTDDEAGGGSVPGSMLPGKAVSLALAGKSADEVRNRLREAGCPVIARIVRDRILLSVRTLDKTDYPFIADALDEIACTGSGLPAAGGRP